VAATALPLAAAAGLGPRRAATVPGTTTQVVVVRGDSRTSASATVDLYQRSGAGWVRAARWRGHNGAKGWTDDHREGDLRTPTGTYSLTDAGGREPDPGTALPYHRSPSFVPSGDSVFGDSLEGSFDYVVAIDYNRRTGRSPLDPTRPNGYDAGGGIWLHVDHGGPTHGCVSLPEQGMRQLLGALRPDARPLVVMGDPGFLRT
jgi:L,D-peptidoglycan transpeptidase YkuD (ErfK/YbiS/YcfS/YnhG family)